MKIFFTKLLEYIKKFLLLVFNPRFLLCFGAAWMMTNGWSYVCLAVGTLLSFEWLIAVSGAYLALMWLPFTPEKIITVALAIFLLKRWFPDDEKTLGVLRELHVKAKTKHEEHKEKKKIEKQKHTDNES